jgi:hypothetical protein
LAAVLVKVLDITSKDSAPSVICDVQLPKRKNQPHHGSHVRIHVLAIRLHITTPWHVGTPAALARVKYHAMRRVEDKAVLSTLSRGLFESSP